MIPFRNAAAALALAVATATATSSASGEVPDGAASISPVADTATTSYEVAGVRVIHRRIAANELVAVNLYLLGGSAVVDATNAGVELMLLRASQYGTRSYPGREARLALARTGSSVFAYSEPDWTVLGFRGMRADFDSTWNVFADRLAHPELDPDKVEIVRARMLRAARGSSRHPDGRLRRLADSVAFAGHVYANEPEGSEQSLPGITIESMREFHAAQMVSSRMLLVVVGNVERSEVESAVARTLAQLPRGDYSWTRPPAWAHPKTTVTVVQQQLPTNYVLGYFAGPQSDSRDYVAFRVATSLLGGITFSMIRDAGLSYAPSAPFLERGAAGGGIYVTTTRPDTTIKIFNSGIEFLREATVPRPMLQRYLRSYLTSYYSQNESLGGQADFLARHELLHGDWRRSGAYMDELRSVQGTDLKRVARQYMRRIQYVYLGNPRDTPHETMMKN